MTTFLEILGFVLAFVSLCVAYYANVRRKVNELSVDAINFAETASELDGAKDVQKMEDAIIFMKTVLPAWAKPFVTDSMLEKAIQFSFDKIEYYAQKQTVKTVEEEKEEITEEE